MTQREQNPFVYSDSNKRYHTYDYYLRQHFGGKCAKLPLDAGFTCPNIDGRCGRGGCRERRTERIFRLPKGYGYDLRKAFAPCGVCNKPRVSRRAFDRRNDPAVIKTHGLQYISIKRYFAEAIVNTDFQGNDLMPYLKERNKKQSSAKPFLLILTVGAIILLTAVIYGSGRELLSFLRGGEEPSGSSDTVTTL